MLAPAVLASGSSNDDDDQVLRLQQQAGAFAVAVFSPPEVLDTGLADFSVLVQDRDTLQPLLDAVVDLRAQDDGNATPASSVRATAHDSEVKLMQSAELDLASAGGWTLHIAVAHGADRVEFSLPVQVVKAESGIALPWPYLILLSFAAILLFAYVRRHRSAKIIPAEEPVSTVP